jgi:hypothetical protein
MQLRHIPNLPVESLKQGRNDRRKYAWNIIFELTLILKNVRLRMRKEAIFLTFSFAVRISKKS